MKSAWMIVLAITCFLGGLSVNSTTETGPSVHQFQDLELKRAERNRSYLPFLNVSSMHCGVYSLSAGAKDGQQPHSEDEVYYVHKGKAKIDIDGTDHDVIPGSIIFIPAKLPHHFHSIETDLETLVFFSKGPIE